MVAVAFHITKRPLPRLPNCLLVFALILRSGFQIFSRHQAFARCNTVQPHHRPHHFSQSGIVGFHAFLSRLIRPLLPLAADFIRLLACFSGGLRQCGLQDLIALLRCRCRGISFLQCGFRLPCRLGCHAPVAGRAHVFQLQTTDGTLRRFFRRRRQ